MKGKKRQKGQGRAIKEKKNEINKVQQARVANQKKAQASKRKTRKQSRMTGERSKGEVIRE